jgi:hypothetical protein
MLASAAQDEHRHAVICSDLCARFGVSAPADFTDEPIAPARLSRRDALLYELAAACCITESESVATLTTLLDADADAPVREALHEIARDEIAHARIGWAHLSREAAARDVSFLGAHLPAMLAGTVDAALFADAPLRSDAEPDAAALLRLGVLPRARKRAIFLAALDDVILPGFEEFGVPTGAAREWLRARQSAREAR